MTTPTTARPTTAAAARTRLSVTRIGIVLAATAVVGWAGTHAIAAAVTTQAPPGPTVFSAYVDVTATPAYPFETPAGPAQADVVLSFVVADPTAPCSPSWGGSYTLDKAASDLQLDRRLSQLRLTGGDARISFGGQRGTELATACTDPSALAAAYGAVVDRYAVTGIDLDLEGATLADTAAASRRGAAIASLQRQRTAAGHPVSVWLTLPVTTSGLTDQGLAALGSMLDGGVDIAGLNGMTMDFGTTTSTSGPLSGLVIGSATVLRSQVSTAYAHAGHRLSDTEAWGKVGITPMIGQNDVPAERFTIADAATVNQFARAQGVGLLSMWSLNRDSTCAAPLPTVLSVVQTSCSGVDQGGHRFADVLASLTDDPSLRSSTPSSGATSSSPAPSTPTVDDPLHSPFPIWDPLGTYPAGTKTVWHHQVFQARFWTSGVAPDSPVADPAGAPWALLGPVLPGDTPAPLPTLPEGTYPQWDSSTAYVAGQRVQVGLVPYEAKWWSRDQRPATSVAGGSPWLLILPAS